MKIEVFGSGCANCRKLYEITKQAAAELGLQDDVTYVTDVGKIVEMGLMSSPVLAINGKPVLVGSLAGIDKIKTLLSETQ